MCDQRSSLEWLKAHGLEATGLSLSQILCSLGFQQCSGEVQSLGRAVASKYGTGLFLQHPDKDGHVYNLVNADEKKLSELEARLTAVIASLKQRLQWLNSGSRKTCGVLSEKRVLLALLGGRKAKRKADPSSTVRAVINLLKEQGKYLTHLNIMSGTSTWKQQLTEVNDEVIVEARQWLLDTIPTLAQDTVSSLIGALTDEQLEAVYLIVEGSQMKEELSDLAGKVLQQHLSIPVHVVVVDCKCSTVLEICQRLASASGGRCHADGDKGGVMYLPRPDVLDIWEELEQARNTLAQVQALSMEVAEKRRCFHDKNNKAEAHTNKSQGAVDSGAGSSRQPKSHRRVVSKVSHTQKGMPTTPSNATQSNTHSTRSKRRTSVQRCNFRKMPRQGATGPHPVPSQQPALHVGWPRMLTRHAGSVARGSTVLACCKQDGFYYKGRVVRNVSYQSVDVEFLDSSYQTTQLSQLILIGGAGPRPLLKSEDCVLCCVRQKCGRFCSKYGICDFFIPAQVQEGSGRGHKIFTVVTFNGEQIVCTRSGLEKISKSRYEKTCSLIVQCQQKTNKYSQLEANACQEKSAEVSTKKHISNYQTPNGQDSSSASSEAVAVCHMIAEREDKATVTESPETVERGTNVCASTQEKAVGTGPQKADQSTSTEVPVLTTHCRDEQLGVDTVDFSTTREGVNTTNKDGNDFTDLPVSGDDIFCRWPENGWYYRARVLGRGKAGGSLIVRAESGEVADVPTSDVIANSISHPIIVGATVLGPHPLFPGSFAPGIVMSIDSDDSRCCVQLYDGLQAQCRCDEVGFLPLPLHETAVTLLQERDSCWVGQAVVARRDSDGVYYPAVVVDKLVGQHFQLQWSDGSYQKQSILHVFGSLTSHRAVHAGDHVLALAMPGIGACLPATVIGTPNEGVVEARFSDGERQKVSKEQCFWISPAYFISAIEYISRVFPSASN